MRHTENTSNLPAAKLAGSARAAIRTRSPTSIICVSLNAVSSAAEALHFGLIKDIVWAAVQHSLRRRLHYSTKITSGFQDKQSNMARTIFLLSMPCLSWMTRIFWAPGNSARKPVLPPLIPDAKGSGARPSWSAMIPTRRFFSETLHSVSSSRTLDRSRCGSK